jgi:16S rRNA C967 or C1407 C5-methylase (RsmB/RsmF family)
MPGRRRKHHNNNNNNNKRTRNDERQPTTTNTNTNTITTTPPTENLAKDFEDEEIDGKGNRWHEPIVKNNILFETYYRQLQLFQRCPIVGTTSSSIPEQQEWDNYISALRRPLPSTFRISPLGYCTQRTKFLLLDLCQDLAKKNISYPVYDETTNEPVVFSPPHPLGPWNPTAWTTGTDRATLRKRPELKQLHQMLVRATDTGAIARQELVSMIPPSVLIKGLELFTFSSSTNTTTAMQSPWILDMCAAPGSKTMQLLEWMECTQKNGVLIANDVDFKRAYMLTKRTNTIRSPCQVITTHDGSLFPHLEIESGGTFHGILCDVPCTGDGTMRKNVDLWRDYNPNDGAIMHPLQLRIALKSMSLLKKDGIMVYSTCSQSPIENEAVICQLLTEYKGEFELIDFTPDLFPGLIRRHGLRDGWNVPLVLPEKHPANTTGARLLKIFSSFSEYEQFIGNASNRGSGTGAPVLYPSMFPPLDHNSLQQFHLERTMRFLPHDQDSGGFFVCALRRLSENRGLSLSTQYRIAQQSQFDSTSALGGGLSSSSSQPIVSSSQQTTDVTTTTTSSSSSSSNNNNTTLLSRRPNKSIHPQDVWYDPITDDIWQGICLDWGIDSTNIPLRDSIVARKTGQDYNRVDGDSVKLNQRLTITNPQVIRMMNLSSQRNGVLRIVNAGVSGFQCIGKGEVVSLSGGGGGNSSSSNSSTTSNTNNLPRYRITQDGIALMRSFITKRVVQINLLNLREACGSIGKLLSSSNSSSSSLNSLAETQPIAATSTSTPTTTTPTNSNNKSTPNSCISIHSLNPIQADLLKSLPPGGLVLELIPPDQERFHQVLGGTLLLSAWWGSKTTISLMVDKAEINELFEQCQVVGLF